MDQINQPGSPAGIPETTPPVVPGAPMGGDGEVSLSQEQMRTNLGDLMAKIDGKYQDFNSQSFSSGNKLKEMDGESLRQVFDLFEEMGVDPSDAKQVAAFLAKVRESNPELSKHLEAALETIIGADTPEENMNITSDETPQENI